jgi:hypothetical protein
MRGKAMVGAAAFVAAMLGLGGLALADNLVVDPDGDATPFVAVDDPTINMGTVCTGTTQDVLLAIKQSGGHNFPNGAEVTVSAVYPGTSAGVGVSYTGNPLVLPGDWNSSAYPNESLSPNKVTAHLQITKTAVGPFSETVKLQATDGTVNPNFVTVTLNGTIQLCGGEAAAAIANGWLNDPANAGMLSVCQGTLGTNKGKTNWRGVLISSIAHEYKGMGSSVNEADVIASVQGLCTGS